MILYVVQYHKRSSPGGLTRVIPYGGREINVCGTVRW